MAKLFVVATPIGNLDDLTPRARQALALADLIAAEDTRVTAKLLSHIGVSKPTISCHRHNEDGRAPEIVARMRDEDITVALTCDAGTPGISDPGHILVAAAWEAGIPVVPISGASATVTALSASGFNARTFAFYGFLPRENKPLREKLAEISRSGLAAAVLYESPHRIVHLVEMIDQAMPACRVCVCSDLTKYYEKIYRGPCPSVLAALRANPNVEKGEYCVVIDLTGIEPVEEPAEKGQDAADCMLRALYDGASLSEAADRAREAGFGRNEIYRVKLRLTRLIEAHFTGDECDGSCDEDA